MKEEIRLADKFNLYEREERELFATLTSSVKDSHERERIQANKTKYLSIIGSILGTLIGITLSAINNHSKISQLKKMVSLKYVVLVTYPGRVRLPLESLSERLDCEGDG